MFFFYFAKNIIPYPKADDYFYLGCLGSADNGKDECFLR